MNNIDLSKYKNALEHLNLIKYSGRVSKVVGLTIESEGPAVELGEVCDIFPLKSDVPIKRKLLGFEGKLYF